MTQVDMASALGTHPLRISEIETLKDIPTEDEMIDLACVLEKTIDYLFPEELLSAIKAGVFSRRKVEMAAPEVISLIEAQRLQLTYDGESEIIDQVSRSLLRDKVKEVLHTLPPQEEKVIRLRFGIDDERSLTQRDVGEKMNLSGGRIQQIEIKALRHLRHRSRARKLKGYLEGYA